MVIGKFTDVFKGIFFGFGGGGGENLRGGLHGKIFSMGEFDMGEENFNEGDAGFF